MVMIAVLCIKYMSWACAKQIGHEKRTTKIVMQVLLPLCHNTHKKVCGWRSTKGMRRAGNT